MSSVRRQSSSSSDSEAEHETLRISRLGKCEVCGAEDAIYTCPKCEVKTCTLRCVRIHKQELECDGVRDRTKFIRIRDFTNTDLLSDYRMLEECARFVYGVKRDEKKRYTRIDRDLPIHLFKLKTAARKRGTVLQFLMQNFSRHKCNTTRYNYKSGVISWRVEWVFPNADPEAVRYVDEKCAEHTKLATLLDKYLSPEGELQSSKGLTYYRSVGFSGVKILLRAEKVHGSAKKYFELDTSESLANNLSGKCIVEFPIIFVVLKDHAYNFEIISADEELETDNNLTSTCEQKKEINGNENACVHNDVTSSHVTDEVTQNGHERPYQRQRPRQLLTEKIAKEKKLQLEKEIRAEKKKKPKNLLFTTGYSSEESISDD